MYVKDCVGGLFFLFSFVLWLIPKDGIEDYQYNRIKVVAKYHWTSWYFGIMNTEHGRKRAPKKLSLIHRGKSRFPCSWVWRKEAQLYAVTNEALNAGITQSGWGQGPALKARYREALGRTGTGGGPVMEEPSSTLGCPPPNPPLKSKGQTEISSS